MERLLELAGKISDQAEVYSLDERNSEVTFENASLKDIDSSMQSGVSLRIIKDGKIGFAYTKNLRDREEFLRNAMDSLKGGVEAPKGFPMSPEVPSLDTFDPAIDSVTNVMIVEECQRVCDRLAGRTSGQVNLEAGVVVRRIRLLNSLNAMGKIFSAVSMGVFNEVLRVKVEKSASRYLTAIVRARHP